MLIKKIPKIRRIEIRLTNEHHKLIASKAKDAKINISDFIRSATLSTNIIQSDQKSKTAIIASINKIGNNLNQLAHVLNIANLSNNLGSVEYKNIIEEIKQAKKSLKAISEKT